MRRIAGRIHDAMRKFDNRAERDPANKMPIGNTYGDSVARVLKKKLFPSATKEGFTEPAQQRQGWNASYEALYVMQGLHTYVMHVTGLVDALGPVAQAVWDKDFVWAVTFCKKELQRMAAWAKQQIGVRAPQTLIVPATFKSEGEDEKQGDERLEKDKTGRGKRQVLKDLGID